MAAEKGAEKLKSLTQVSAVGYAESLKAGDQFVMVCGKCQTVMMHTVSNARAGVGPGPGAVGCYCGFGGVGLAFSPRRTASKAGLAGWPARRDFS